nr:MAG TPA: hypothetical protein [Caudoviricetes sp.]
MISSSFCKGRLKNLPLCLLRVFLRGAIPRASKHTTHSRGGNYESTF